MAQRGIEKEAIVYQWSGHEQSKIPEWANSFQFVTTKNLKTRIMNSKQQAAEVKAQQKEQQRLSGISLRNDCLRMALEYHRGVQNKNGWSIDMSAIENVDFGKGKKKLTPNDIVELFLKEGKLIYRSIDGSGKSVHSRAVQRIEHPEEITLSTILKTANSFFVYISQNKLK